MALYRVHFLGGPCNGRVRSLTFLMIPNVLVCRGDRYTHPVTHPNLEIFYTWDELKPVPVPSEVAGSRDVLRAFKGFMQARVRATRILHDSSLRARALIRRAVR